MMQTVTEQKSLWRINNSYKKDASHCENCQSIGHI